MTPTHHFRRGLRLALLAATGLACAMPAYAQAGGEEEVVVTARKRKETSIQVPAQVTAISAATLEARGVTTIAGLSQQVPSFIGGPALLLDTLFIRGIGTATNNPGFEQSVGLFIDGIYYGNGRWANQGYFDLANAQIMKGPQGVFFGKNTIAGAIDLTSRDPGSEYEANISAGYEFNAKQRYAQAGITIPVSDTFGIRVFGRVDSMDGWMHDRYSNVDGPASDEAFGRVTFKWTPSEDLTLTWKSSVFTSENNGPGIAFVLSKCGGPGNTASATPFGANPVPCGAAFHNYQWTNDSLFGPFYGTLDNYTNTLSIEWAVGPGTLTSVTGYNNYKMAFLVGSSYSPVNTTLAFEEVENTAFSQEVRYQTEFDGPVNLIAGVYFQSTDYYHLNAARVRNEAQQGTVNGRPTLTWSKPSTQDGTSFAAFAEISWKIVPELELSVGGRYTEEKKDSWMKNVAAAPNYPFMLVPVYEANQTFENFSPTATLTWQPDSETSVYLAYKTGFKAGGFSHGGTIFYLAPGGQPTLQSFLFGSEKASGFEGGVKGYLWDRKFRYELVGYAYDFEDLQVNAYNAATNSFTVQNAATAVQRGVELSASWFAAEGLTLAATLNYNNTEFDEFIAACNTIQVRGSAPCNVRLGAGFGQDLRGRATANAPEWTGRLDVTYETPISETLELSLTAGAQYSDWYYLANDGRDDNKQDSYVRLNASARLASTEKGWAIDLIGQNLTNEFVAIQGGERSGAGADLSALPDRARSIELRLTYNFGS